MKEKGESRRARKKSVRGKDSHGRVLDQPKISTKVTLIRKQEHGIKTEVGAAEKGRS